MKPINAWWFSEGYKLSHLDGRVIKLRETHEVEGPLVLCQYGLHGSIKALDALRYAPGAIAWAIELSGEIIKGEDKLCASSRKYVAGGVDATQVLRKFARLCALDVAHLWDCPEVVLEYLKTGDDKLRSAAYSTSEKIVDCSADDAAGFAVFSAVGATADHYTAWSAAWYAANDAARSAAGAANGHYTAWSAADGAACFAARSAAGATAGHYTAWVAGRNTVKKTQNTRLTKMLNELIKQEGEYYGIV